MGIFDVQLSTVPKARFYPEHDLHGEFEGLHALTYDGFPLEGKPTKVYAVMGWPENTAGPVPGVVLVHGGGGHPNADWAVKWIRRGYAVIAMSTTGHFPTEKGIPFVDGNEKFFSRDPGDFAEEGYVCGPDNASVTDWEKPIEDQWMYHAVSQVILAHNLLRADPRVDADRIGISGISWGGVITALVIGFDTRFSFAVPIYGSGALQLGLSDICEDFKHPESAHWLADHQFDRMTMPVLWLCWNDDCCFSIHSNSASYAATRNLNPKTRLSMKDQMMHSHPHGWRPEESYWFADAVLSGGDIPEVRAEFADNRVRYACSESQARARLFWIPEKMSYVLQNKYGIQNRAFMKGDWQILNLEGSCGAAGLPENFAEGYVEFTLPNGVILTTEYHQTE